MDLITPFFFLAAFQLLRLTIEDIKTRTIDHATIQFMTGIVIFIYLVSNKWIDGIIILLIATFALNFLQKNQWIKERLIGLEDGDILTLIWVTGGLFIFGITPLAIFIGVFISVLYFMQSKKIKDIPALVPITVSFIVSWSYLILIHLV